MSDQAQAVAPSIDDRIAGAMGLIEAPEKPPEEAPVEASQEQEAEQEAAEDVAEAPTEEAPEEPTEEAPPAWDEVREVKLKVPLVKPDGTEEREVTLDELRLGYMRQDDYQRKTQEIAQTKKQAQEEAMKAVSEVRSRVEQELKAMDAFITNVALPELNGVDWNALAQNDPAEFVRMSHRANQVNAAKQQVQAQLQATEQQRIAEEQQKLAQALPQAEERLKAKIPNWSKELQAALFTTGKDIGFSEDELSRVYDPRFVELLHDAHQYRNAQKAQPIADKKIAVAPRVLKPGAKPAEQSKQRSAYEALRTKVKKSGGKDKAAIEELIKLSLG
jgi:hypothetical protein